MTKKPKSEFPLKDVLEWNLHNEMTLFSHNDYNALAAELGVKFRSKATLEEKYEILRADIGSKIRKSSLCLAGFESARRLLLDGELKNLGFPFSRQKKEELASALVRQSQYMAPHIGDEDLIRQYDNFLGHQPLHGGVAA